MSSLENRLREVPKELVLPNVRRCFLPDPGHVLLDCDLAGADAQVVAWEADDADLKDAFRKGLNVHNHNGRAMWGDAYDPAKRLRNGTMRDELKRAVHGSNYGVSARTLAITLGWTTAQAQEFQDRWFHIHPKIKEWQDGVVYKLNTTRTITNAFGYRIVYFDRPDNLVPKALAWGPQSTVGRACARGAVALRKYLPYCRMRLQVHDSVVFQIPLSHFTEIHLAEIKHVLHSASGVPFTDPLTIPWDIAASTKSWGECKKIDWTGKEKE